MSLSMSRIIDLAVAGLLVLVFALKFAGASVLAIAIGLLVLPTIGIVVALVDVLANVPRQLRSTMHALNRGEKTDFSSFSAAEEHQFAGHEQHMAWNEVRASLIGYGIAAGGLVLGVVVVAAMYTPCSKFCERPPSSCKTSSQEEAFKNACPAACSNLEKTRGGEYVETLTGCAFAGSTSGGCEEVTRSATAVGLWCESKD